jgi:hypothetical protein
VYYRPKTKAVILLDMGHSQRGEYTHGRNQERKGNIKLEYG